MPTARELLEQADALMRRNRSTATDDIPVLTDSVALPSGQPIAVVTPANARQAEADAAEAAARAVPVLTESVEVDADNAADVQPVDVAAEGEPSDWLESDRGEPSAIGEAPDSIVIVPSVLRATPRGVAASSAPAYEEIELTTPAEAEFDEEFDGEFDADPDEATVQRTSTVLDLRLGEHATSGESATVPAAEAAPLPDAESGDAPADTWPGVAAEAMPAAAESDLVVDEDGIVTLTDEVAPDTLAFLVADAGVVEDAPPGDVPTGAAGGERREVDAGAGDGDGSDPAESVSLAPYDEPSGDDFVAPAERDELAQTAEARPSGEHVPAVEYGEALEPIVAIDADADAGPASIGAAPAPDASGAREAQGEADAPAPHPERDERRDRTSQVAEGRDALIAMTLAASAGAPGIPLQTTPFRLAADGGGATSVPYAIALPVAPPTPEPPVPAPAEPDPEALAALQAAEQAKWDSLAEEVRMQVLQRIDLFTDTGLRDQLALRLQPIVDRASAELVATINQHIGLLLRGYVAEAIEREIENWRRNQ